VTSEGRAGGDFGPTDGIEGHLRPPAVAVAVARGSVRAVGAFGVLERRLRFEVGELLRHRIEHHDAIRAEAQILPLPSTSMVTRRPSGDIGGVVS